MDSKRKINIIAAITLAIYLFIPCFKIGGYGSNELYSAFKLLYSLDELFISSEIVMYVSILFFCPFLIFMINHFSTRSEDVCTVKISTIGFVFAYIIAWISIADSLSPNKLNILYWTNLLVCIAMIVVSTRMISGVSDKADNEYSLNCKEMDNKRIIIIEVAIALIIMIFIPSFEVGVLGYNESRSVIQLLIESNNMLEYFGANSLGIKLIIFLIIGAPLGIAIINSKINNRIGGVATLILSCINLLIWVKIDKILDDLVMIEKMNLYYLALIACITTVIVSIVILISNHNSGKESGMIN
ncbi:MAG: hypothetical protein K6A38_06030 [Lachnospiraceae bacterium]|nr:hypothetical protein [Lachnospiraceae bacterium]